MSKSSVTIISLPNCHVEIEEIPDKPQKQRVSLSHLQTISESYQNTAAAETSKRKRGPETVKNSIEKPKLEV